ncbi:saccharopine dehydrogenase C-terminal domain-containing protein [Saccharicrinis fermentans]|uniref:Spermidine synthase n=1 Tax=Saccharicrinis fermentans DSM 9555 = JCM 21142 TaxID=869213 RepID=W7XU33_9BACT|nr:saccharopine dehydrogenase C-terminal domain-containing protein [Saccharicrinis fermentans]GAF01535.1 spermidine synthase [Saccharicrinis fermentans DSM 9555 = JCM 21142]
MIKFKEARINIDFFKNELYIIVDMNNNNQILILGAGKVAAPLVKYLLRKKYKITVASELLYQAELIIENNPQGTAVEWHSDDINKLHTLVKQHLVIVSLLPYHLHLLVCKACIRNKKNMITTSYQQAGMDELHSEAYRNNICILNEMGLDPGIDHMWASQMIDTIKEKGGKVEKFISVCGALPSPESLDNPFRYKFSWSPTGVMKASSSHATYLKNNTIIEHDASALMKNTLLLNFEGLGEMEAYANRNALKYISLYRIPEAETFFRGTLRYKGWCEVMDTLIECGYLSEQSFPKDITTYAELTSYLTKLENTKYLRDHFAQKMGLKTHSSSIMSMEWIGLFSSAHFSPSARTPLSVLTNKMLSKMKMLPSDKDLIVLNHQLLYKLPNGTKKLLSGTFKLSGSDNENTAIANTVSYPAALGAELLLQNKIAHKGIIRPFYKEIYDPILKQLKKDFNFVFMEEELDPNKWSSNW